jgi:Flp pilus assembly protein TadB
MSKERQRRREERERQQAIAAAERERREVKRRRRQQRMRAVRDALPKRTRWNTQQGRLADKRKRRAGLLIAIFVVVQVVTWLMTPNWYARGAALIVCLFALPVAWTLLFRKT